MRSHPYLEQLVAARRFAFVYGPFGTGKTRLAVHVAKLALGIGLNPLFVETEAVGTAVSRLYEGAFKIATSFDEMVHTIALAALSKRYLVVDSINSFYLSEPPSIRKRALTFVAATLKRTGGFAVGQVREKEGVLTSPGLNLVSSYADVIARTEKIDRDRFKLEVLKPERKLMLFRVSRGDVEWL
ncbi:MAG: hypothetical protein QXN05_05940 [Acidilobaceae archaeon]